MSENLQKVRNYLKMNLESNKTNCEIADKFGSTPQVVSIARCNFKFAREYEIDIDKHLVYAWRWSDDCRYAKIGEAMAWRLRERMITTFHPTDDILLIGTKEYDTKKEAQRMEKHILDTLCRTRCDREWVKINENFNNKLINEGFTIHPNKVNC